MEYQWTYSLKVHAHNVEFYIKLPFGYLKHIFADKNKQQVLVDISKSPLTTLQDNENNVNL